MNNKKEWYNEVIVVDTVDKWNDFIDYIFNKSHHQYLVIDNGNCSENELKELVRNNVNRYIYIVLKQGDYATYYTYEITYKSVFDKDRGCNVFDEDYTIQYHLQRLKKYIVDDVKEFDNYIHR